LNSADDLLGLIDLISTQQHYLVVPEQNMKAFDQDVHYEPFRNSHDLITRNDVKIIANDLAQRICYGLKVCFSGADET